MRLVDLIQHELLEAAEGDRPVEVISVIDDAIPGAPTVVLNTQLKVTEEDAQEVERRALWIHSDDWRGLLERGDLPGAEDIRPTNVRRIFGVPVEIDYRVEL